jgi:putative flippase GtrA
MLIREMAKFGIIGIFNMVLDTAIFNVLQVTVMEGSPLKAKVVATVISATSSYFMNRHWTFRHRSRSGLRREYTLFFLFNAVGLAIQLGVLGMAKYGFGVDDLLWINVFNFIGIGFGTLFRFWTYRRWVFLHPEDTLYETADEPIPAPAPR